MFAKFLMLKSLFLLSISNALGMELKEVKQEITAQQTKLPIPTDIQNILIPLIILDCNQNEIIPTIKSLRLVCKFFKGKIDTDKFTQFVLDHLEQLKDILFKNQFEGRDEVQSFYLKHLNYKPLELKIKNNVANIFGKGYLPERVNILKILATRIPDRIDLVDPTDFIYTQDHIMAEEIFEAIANYYFHNNFLNYDFLENLGRAISHKRIFLVQALMQLGMDQKMLKSNFLNELLSDPLIKDEDINVLCINASLKAGADIFALNIASLCAHDYAIESKKIIEQKMNEQCLEVVKDENYECPICLNKIDFETEIGFKLSPCQHAFHKDCIIPWVKEHKNCPQCKQNIDN